MEESDDKDAEIGELETYLRGAIDELTLGKRPDVAAQALQLIANDYAMLAEEGDVS